MIGLTLVLMLAPLSLLAFRGATYTEKWCLLTFWLGVVEEKLCQLFFTWWYS